MAAVAMQSKSLLPILVKKYKVVLQFTLDP